MTWEDIVGEPDGIRSPECAWRLSGQCFRLSRGCCYIFLSVLVAPLVALCMGLTFACLAFGVSRLDFHYYDHFFESITRFQPLLTVDYKSTFMTL